MRTTPKRPMQQGLVLKRVLMWLLGIALALVLAGLAGVWYIGAWNLVFPTRTQETVPPTLPAFRQPAILLFTKTNSFRHTDGIEAGSALIKEIAGRRGWDVFHTENGAVFNETDLARFAGVIFHNASGDTLNEQQEQSFQRWLEAGGGWLGTHSSGDGSHADWKWYVDTLIGVKFTAHIMGPQFQVAVVNVEDHDHPVSRELPASWEHKEEWYSWESSPRELGFDILATIDESTYTPVADFAGTKTDLAMGDHPILWSRCVAQGRAVYSTMGHAAFTYEDPHHQTLIESAMAWIVGETSPGCEQASGE